MKKLITLSALLFFLFGQVLAQTNTITFTLEKQPCANDGIIIAHAPNTLTPPVTFGWNVAGKTITQTSSTTDDTLFSYSGVSLYVTVLPGVAPYTGTYPGSPPFTYRIDNSTSAVCPALGSAHDTTTGGTAPFKVEWLDLNGIVVYTGNPGLLPAGSFNILITDGAGCQYGSFGSSASGGFNQGAVYIKNGSTITFAIDTTMAHCRNGSATVKNVTGGVSPYGYAWSNGANSPSISGLSMGYYYVTVTDDNGCYNSMGVNIQQNPAITVNTTPKNATCLENDGSIIAFGSGGLPPYSYLWNNTEQTQSISGLTAGAYSVSVTDANNCIGSKYTEVASSTPVTVTYSAKASSCTVPDGTATLSISGGTSPYTVNWYTYPPQTGITATGLQPGAYSFLVNDAGGCVRNGTVIVPSESALAATIYSVDAQCTQSNGRATVIVTSGFAPFSFLWSTAETTSSISNLSSKNYSCLIIDKKGCSITKNVYVKVASPIQVSLNNIPSTCIYSNDGSIAATASGGTAPYTYYWSNGQVTPTATGLQAGYYSVYVSDAAGCINNNWTKLISDNSDNSCYCNITGKVYEDQNSNCTYDSGEPGIANIMIHASGLGYAFTNADGDYSFLAPTGAYTLSESVQAYYPLASCQGNSIPVTVTASSGCVTSNDFANVINPIHDVRICTTNLNPPVPGHNYLQNIVVENKGTVTEPAVQVGYAHDGQLVFTGAAPALFTQQNAGSAPNWYSVTSGLSLNAGASQKFNINYKVPTNIPGNTEVVFNDTTAYESPMDKWLADYTPWNNVNQYENTVLSSFDPNYIEVTPKGYDVPGYITKDDSILSYTIHFQNTGTYQAENIVLIDTLDANLDIASLEPGFSAHAYTVAMNENGVVTFTFNNINLPDSTSNRIGSNAFVMYTVKLKHQLPGNTQIKNASSVYFDYNAPVKTNTALNTIADFTVVNHTPKSVFDFIIYPNPANGIVSLLINSGSAGEAALKIYNLVGQQVQAKSFRLEKGKNIIPLDASSLPSGLYFTEVSSGKNSMRQKLSVSNN